MNYDLRVKTAAGGWISFDRLDRSGETRSDDGLTVSLTAVAGGLIRVGIKPKVAGNRILAVSHRITTGLRNFHQVIVPDSGRGYSPQTQLVGFWASRRDSVVRNLCVPLFIFTGQDHTTSLAFGVVGQPYETSFSCLQPFSARALSAYTRRLSLEISRGYQDNPVPPEFLAEDGSLVEHLFVRDHPAGSSQPWLMTLREFTHFEKEIFNISFPFNPATTEPLWCSWTDWHSDDVDETVIREQVKVGLELGIKNFIIDDGWFGPGLDSDRSVELNIGDWQPDPAKINDLPALSREIRQAGGRSIIWCAPHAVGRLAACRGERERWLARDREQRPISTSNQFNILCLRCPEAREVMAEICVRLAVEYETDGAKYDLFNCIPEEPCCSARHEHDTESMLVGLNRLLALIWQRVGMVKPDYIVELKQNYGGTFLSRYGTMMRAGDTPYANEGNFWRTAHVQGYNQMSLNDYQSITPFDPVDFAAAIVIKMMAVGIPSYSMDMNRLPTQHRRMLKFYHQWYAANLELLSEFRVPLDPDLNLWQVANWQREIYFLVNAGAEINTLGRSRLTVLNGSLQSRVRVRLPAAEEYQVQLYDYTGELREQHCSGGGLEVELSLPIGWLAVMRKVRDKHDLKNGEG